VLNSRANFNCWLTAGWLTRARQRSAAGTSHLRPSLAARERVAVERPPPRDEHRGTQRPTHKAALSARREGADTTDGEELGTVRRAVPLATAMGPFGAPLPPRTRTAGRSSRGTRSGWIPHRHAPPAHPNPSSDPASTWGGEVASPAVSPRTLRARACLGFRRRRVGRMLRGHRGVGTRGRSAA